MSIRRHTQTIVVAVITSVAVAGAPAVAHVTGSWTHLRNKHVRPFTDQRYFRKITLQSPGTINTSTNPVDWTKLKGVPAGLADGADADSGGDITAVNAGTGLAGGADTGAVNLNVDFGTGPNQAAAGDHLHDGRYYTETELQTSGSASVHWDNLSSVPAGFADGVDDTSGTASDLVCSGCVGTSDLAPDAVTSAKILDGEVAAADLAFDPATQGELDALAAAGTINDAGNPVDWTKLKGVPAGLADGTDNDTTYTGSQGIAVVGTDIRLDDCAANEVWKRNSSDTAWTCAADLTAAVKATAALAGTVDTTAATEGSITVTFPSNGFALISSEATFEPTSLAPPGQINASIMEGATTVQSWTWDAGDDDGNVDRHESFSGVTSVTAGSHTYDLQLQTVGAVSTADFANLRIVVMFFPTGL